MNTLLRKLDEHSLRKKREIRIFYSKGMTKLQLAVKYGVDILEIVEIVKGCKRESAGKEPVADSLKTELTPDEVNERIAVMQGWSRQYSEYSSKSRWSKKLENGWFDHCTKCPDFYHSWEFTGPLLEEKKFSVTYDILDQLWNVFNVDPKWLEPLARDKLLTAAICLAYLEMR